jgi:hypothetical protein
MKRIVRLAESDLTRIVRQVINEEHTDWPLCRDVKVTQGSFEGEKDDFGFLRYDVNNQGKVIPVGTGGTPKMCKFKRLTKILLQGGM